jgi:UDP-N-acetylmuramoyl-tripeptide--D-alanyl-D-alanine ligase
MKAIAIKELAKAIKARPSAEMEHLVTGVSIDSRTVKAGECFFAVSGDHFNGEDFVFESLNKGAGCAVVSRNSKIEAEDGKTILKVDSPIEALGSLAGGYRRNMKFKVIAITGSVGKTTTRHIIYNVLSRRFKCHQAPKNFNNQIGLPLTLLGAESDHRIVVAELASSSPGEISKLSKIAAPDIAVITNVCPAHLEGLGDLETIAEEKSSIVEGLGADGTLIINGDSPTLVDACRKKGAGFTTFGTSKHCDIRAEGISYDGPSSRFTIDGTEIFLPLPGRGNVENALAAWTACRQFGIDIDDFADVLRQQKPVPMRTEVVRIGTLTVLNDCYNANPVSMQNALEILKNLGSNSDSPPDAQGRRKVFIYSDMAELGGRSRQLHEQLGRQIAQTEIGFVMAIGKFAKTAADIAKKLDSRLQVKSFADTESACKRLKKFVKDYDIIVVKGSRTAGLERVVEKLREIFDVRA